jgi:hypothetical protein
MPKGDALRVYRPAPAANLERYSLNAVAARGIRRVLASEPEAADTNAKARITAQTVALSIGPQLASTFPYEPTAFKAFWAVENAIEAE